MPNTAATLDLAPMAVTLAADRRSLVVDWGDGKVTRADAAVLREACRSSRSVRARVDGKALAPTDDTTIVDVRPIGRYAINLVFSDGHDRGIYPWAYLKEVMGRDRSMQHSACQGN